MGHGQEALAEAALDSAAALGGWVFLQNIHLIQSWLPTLERKLQELGDTADNRFRCFISAEPPLSAPLKNIPEGLLQSSLKVGGLPQIFLLYGYVDLIHCLMLTQVANECPADLKSNFKRAWIKFSEDKLSDCKRKEEYKACLFALCFYHSTLVGRGRLGYLGWSQNYRFSHADMMACVSLLQYHLNNTANEMPWQMLQYMFGEVIYGGHISDYWDRRTSNTYLKAIFHDDLLANAKLAPSFASPNPADYNYKDYLEHIEKGLRDENAALYGVHPNADVESLTASTDNIFSTILRMRFGSVNTPKAKADVAPDTTTNSRVADLLAKLPKPFSMLDLTERAHLLLETVSREI